MGMCDDIITAYSGERDYEGNAASNLRVLMSGQTNTFHIIVRADSDIHSLTDIKGKRVSLGPSGAPYFGPDMIEATTGYVNGQDYTGQYLGHDQAAEALQTATLTFCRHARLSCLRLCQHGSVRRRAFHFPHRR